MAGDTNVAAALTACHHALKLAREEKATASLSSEQFRTIICCCQKLSSTSNSLLPPSLAEIADTLLETLADCSLSAENQPLASTAFCLALNLIQEPPNISLMFSKVFIPSTEETFQIKLSKATELHVSVVKPQVFKLCLCHGLLHLGDGFWSSEHLNWNDLMYTKMFPLLELHCLSSDHLTSLAFKCLANWLRKVRSCGKSSRRVSGEVLGRVLSIVGVSWESPVIGADAVANVARELLTLEAEQAPQLRPPALLLLLLTEQSWMVKSKYAFLAVVLPKCGTLKTLLRYERDIVNGLINSLSYPHLAPVGAELYRVCLESMTSEHFEQIFFQRIINVLVSSKYMLPKQNLFNYWISPTIKKYKVVLELILDTVLGYGNVEDVLFSVVCCLKVGRKEGHEAMQWPTLVNSPFLAQALEHHNETIRAHAFAAVCISSKTSIAPSDSEFQLVESFLVKNINVDHSALRQSMLNSFTVFLCRLRDACLAVLKTRYHNDPGQFENRALTRSMIFLEWLYNFLKSNLEVGANFQRKYTSLEIYRIVLTHLSSDGQGTTKRKSQSGRDKGVDGVKVMKHAIAVGKWAFTSEASREVLLYCTGDPEASVRETAGALLMGHFKTAESESPRFALLFKKALALCSDPLFYYAESGALLMQVVTTLSYKSCGLRGLGREGWTLLSVAEAQGASLRSDLLSAAAHGSPLHGLLRALHRLLSSTDDLASLSGSAERLRLIQLVESTVKHLLQILASKSSDISDYAPSFCEMGEAIESTVEESAVSVEESDKLQLSPAYQLVLNCIWLNLRACCSVASSLVENCTGLSPNEVERCCALVASILRHCRHKGATEVAATELASIISQITSGGNADLVLTIERQILNPALSRLIDHHHHSGNMTQSTRGAGTVMLIHRVIASDSRPNKPMLEWAVNRLLSSLNSNEEWSCDLPQVMQLLGALVKDSSLTQLMATHYHTMTIAALTNLDHHSWPVRNAALQLFGALVPKLVGQRKRQEDESGCCSCYHLPYEDLLYHSRPLVSALLTALETPHPHSRLVPVLTLLSNLSVGILTIADRSLEGVFHKIVNSTQNLMSSRIDAVRRLAAKANAWFCSPSQLSSLIKTRVWKIVAFVNDRSLENEIKTENCLHGFLLNTEFLCTRFSEEKAGNSTLREQETDVSRSLDELRSVRNSNNLSFVCKAVLCRITGFDDSLPAPDQVEETMNIMQNITSIKMSIGLHEWGTLRIEQVFKVCCLNELVPALSICILQCEIPELHQAAIRALHVRIERPEFESVLNPCLNIIFQFLTKKIHTADGNLALKILLDMVVRYGLKSVTLNSENLISILISEPPIMGRPTKVSPAALALASALLLKSVNSHYTKDVVLLLRANSDPENCDEESRKNSAKGIVLLAPLFQNNHTERLSKIKSWIWEIAITLLQDENAEVRLEASRFVQSLDTQSLPNVPNPNVALGFLFKESMLKKILPLKYIIKCLWSRLQCSATELESLDYILDRSVLNPYDHGVPNIYEEPCKIVDRATETLLDLLAHDKEACITLLENEILPNLKQLREQCLKFLTFGSDQVLANSAILDNHWYVVSKKLGHQCKVINAINNKGLDDDFEMFQYRFQSFLEGLVLDK